MTRGKGAKIGDTNIAANGYHYTRTESGWRLTHHLVAEKKYDRFVDPAKEMVVFLDKDRTNFSPSNIEIRQKNVGTNEKRIARIKAHIEELQAELEELESGIRN